MSELFEGSTYDEYKKYLIAMRKDNPQLAEIAMRLQEDDDYIAEILSDTDLSNRAFVEVIALCRRVSYGKSMGGANKAAENETDSLCARNHWKFVEEFLQNADDCEYEQTPGHQTGRQKRRSRQKSEVFLLWRLHRQTMVSGKSAGSQLGREARDMRADGVYEQGDRWRQYRPTRLWDLGGQRLP